MYGLSDAAHSRSAMQAQALYDAADAAQEARDEVIGGVILKLQGIDDPVLKAVLNTDAAYNELCNLLDRYVE